jgi:hypothetical protein
VAATQRGGGVAQGGALADQRHERRIVVTALEAQQLAQRGAADDAVDRDAGVALELAEGAHGGVAEDAVDAPGVEPEGAEALLEFGDVVTPQHRGPAVQEAVTEPETRFYQGVPRLRATDAVDAQATQALEGLHGGAGGRAEDPVGIDGRARQDGGQAVLDVGVGGAAVADGEGQAYR